MPSSALATPAPVLTGARRGRALAPAAPRRPSPRQERLANRLFLALSPRLRAGRQTSPSRLYAFEHIEIERSQGRGTLSATWYQAAGTARGAVLLAHPWVVWGEGYFHRRGRVEALQAAGYHALTFDLGGVGASGPASGAFYDRDLEDALAALAARAGGLPLHFWGVSCGGYWGHPLLSRVAVAGAMFEDVPGHLIEWSSRMAPWGLPCYLFFRHCLRPSYRYMDLCRHAPHLRVRAAAYVSGGRDRGTLPAETAELARLAGAGYRLVPDADHLESIKLAGEEVIRLALETYDRAESVPAATSSFSQTEAGGWDTGLGARSVHAVLLSPRPESSVASVPSGRTPPERDSMPLRLIVETDDRMRRFPLAEGAQRLGSSPGSAVRIHHPSVSRHHAMIHVGGDRVEIEDLGSRNGTRAGGQRVTSRQALKVGDTMTFGAVAAVLEEVSDKDLEPAVAFAAPAAQPAPSEYDAMTATAALGTTRLFALKQLPDLLACLTEGRGVARTSQAAGAALFESLPCLAVEILSGEHQGMLFSARYDEVDDAWGNEARVEHGAVTVRVGFVHPSHARTYSPLIEVCAMLIQLAAGGETPPAAPATRAAPRLPEPPTVVPEVRRIYADAGRVARGGVSVLIRGASGTGKEVLARYLHAASNRAQGPFVALNCAALPRDLLESELFGIERGVATGVESRAGKFEIAAAGTLFLDEIGDMALETQARILRVLQEGEVYRLGGQQPRCADVRVVAASHRDLEAMQHEGSFRSDLYHRIADWTVRLPRLAERRADVPNLAAYFLAREARRRGLEVAGISRGAMELLEAYTWPGNIRQLEREMARAALFLEPGELLESSHLQDAIRQAGPTEAPSLKARLERVERREIHQALARHDGSVSAAAKELKMGLSTLYRRMQALGVEADG